MNWNGKGQTFANLYSLFEQHAKTLRLADSTIILYIQTVKKFCAWADAEGLEPHTHPFHNVLSYIGGLKREDGEPSAVNIISDDQQYTELALPQTTPYFWKSKGLSHATFETAPPTQRLLADARTSRFPPLCHC